MADDIDENTVPQMVRELMPSLPMLCLCNELSIKGHALAVVAGIISALGFLTGKFQKEVMALITPSLQQWVEIFTHTLATPVVKEKEDLKAKTEV